MHKTIIAGLALAGLTLVGCSKAEQADADRKTKEAGAKVTSSVQEGVNKVASDADIQKAKAEAEQAAKQAGDAVKAAGAEAKDAAATAAKDAAHDVARNTKAAIHEATAPTPEEQAEAEKKK
jgi:colicin import membrane protein